MNITGTAFCKKCNFFNTQIVLTGHRETDEGGGWNWKVVARTVCQNCGEQLIWLHQPPSHLTLLPAAAQTRFNLTDYAQWKNAAMPK